MRGKTIIWLSLLAVLLTSPVIANFSFAQTTPTMFVSPPTTQTNPTELFMVTVDVADAVGVAGFEFKVTWDLALTEFPPEVGEGYFLQDTGIPVYQTSQANILFKYVLVSAFLTAYGWADGNGTLATVTFQVKATESGSSSIHLYDTKLFDTNGVLIPHNVVDGSFYTTKPKPVFSWTPVFPVPMETVTFDGTASYDPDGGNITAYEWNFGDGSPHAFGPVVTHAYASYNIVPYQVTLTVTDSDQMQSWFVTKPLQIWRDLGIVSVWPSMTEADTTDYDAYATTLDYYEDPGYGLLSVIVTVVNFGTLGESYSLSVIIEGTDYNGAYHNWEIAPTAIWFMGTEYPTSIGAGRGSGWANWMLFDISYGATTSKGLLGHQINTPVPPGQYTITATLTSTFDQDPSNNVLTAPFGVHGQVEFQGVLTKFQGNKWHMSNGPLPLVGMIRNLDNTIGVFRDPIDIQGEYGRIVYEIQRRGSGNPVAIIHSDDIYLDYNEGAVITSLWGIEDGLAPGRYTMVAYAEFGTDGVSFPYFSQYSEIVRFAVLP